MIKTFKKLCRMSPKISLFPVLIACLFAITFLAWPQISWAGSIQLVTYYPAPQGAYDRVTFIPQASLPATCNIGSLIVEQTSGKIFYCHNIAGIGTWGPLSNVWTMSGNYIFPTSTDSNPNIFAAIGTSAPNFKLTLDNDGGILAMGTFGSGAGYSDLSAGRLGTDNPRLIWYPSKAAFRAVSVSDTSSDVGKIGNYSVAFGKNNLASGIAAVASGQNNTASGDYSTIAGGSANSASASYATITGGTTNTASGQYTTVSGSNNTASGDYSTLGGGQTNSITELYSTIHGGKNNLINKPLAFNKSDYSTISGGESNTIWNNTGAPSTDLYSTIGGGFFNLAQLDYSTIGGGDHNTAGILSYVGGGSLNRAGGYSVVGGGLSNSASGSYSVITGGQSNSAGGSYSTILGGTTNRITSGSYSLIAGGASNTLNGSNSVIAGGSENTLNSVSYSWVGGRHMRLNLPTGFPAGAPVATFVWGYSDTDIDIRVPYSFILAPGTSGGNPVNPKFSIHETNPSAILSITNPASAVDYLAVTKTTPGDIFIVKANGYIGIGNNNPQYPLQVGNIAGPQGILTAGGVWTTPSSRKFKTNIQPLNPPKALETLRELHPVTYNYKIDKAEHHVGFIAEDVPDLLAEPGRKGLNPMPITAVLTSVLKDQKKTLERQGVVLDDLENQVHTLSNDISHRTSHNKDPL